MGQTGGWPGAQKVPKSGYRAHLGLQPEADFQAQTTGASQTEHRTRPSPGTAKGSLQQLINSPDQFPTPFSSKCGGRQPPAAHLQMFMQSSPLGVPPNPRTPSDREATAARGRPSQEGSGRLWLPSCHALTQSTRPRCALHYGEPHSKNSGRPPAESPQGMEA